MARFHINSKGEPGKCKAFTGNCPYGDEDVHYHTADAAYEAIEANQGGAFGPKQMASTLPDADAYMAQGGSSDDWSSARGMIDDINYDRVQDHHNLLTQLHRSNEVRLRGRDKELLARRSQDPAELMALAESITGRRSGRRIARALAKNSYATAEILVEARSRSAMAWSEFVDLEMHPDYPMGNFTNEGAYRFAEALDPYGERVAAQSNEAGDRSLDQLLMKIKDPERYDQLAVSALENPNNKLTYREIRRLAKEKPTFAAAAARSGRFPDERDLRGSIYTAGSGGIPEESFTAAAEVHEDNKVLGNIYDRHRNTPHMVSTAKAILSNPNVSPLTKMKLRQDIKPLIDEYLDVMDATGK